MTNEESRQAYLKNDYENLKQNAKMMTKSLGFFKTWEDGGKKYREKRDETRANWKSTMNYGLSQGFESEFITVTEKDGDKHVIPTKYLT